MRAYGLTFISLPGDPRPRAQPRRHQPRPTQRTQHPHHLTSSNPQLVQSSTCHVLRSAWFRRIRIFSAYPADRQRPTLHGSKRTTPVSSHRPCAPFFPLCSHPPATLPPPSPRAAASLSSPPRLKFLDRVRWHLRVKRYSIRTETAYTDWIRGLHPLPREAPSRDNGRTGNRRLPQPPRRQSERRGLHSKPSPLPREIVIKPRYSRKAPLISRVKRPHLPLSARP